MAILKKLSNLFTRKKRSISKNSPYYESNKKIGLTNENLNVEEINVDSIVENVKAHGVGNYHGRLKYVPALNSMRKKRGGKTKRNRGKSSRKH